ncbi:hypothetical protein DACRYDRAFT_106988 [Dacryopinax primogenitus]|uniref:Uncharacterized protein n=1 Tax=Dacryopinax primogenitus (strain DJM 731) TaxID=1858805 RepID=M5G3W9_DACPD|nr:uncharacterized protein DACRYDRAFT_106988 [Dacryopinax primogenitus]EJU02905.1 hypothetical protein DACRYDRAFT_106988 [Dacryopinax primogenitus]
MLVTFTWMWRPLCRKKQVDGLHSKVSTAEVSLKSISTHLESMPLVDNVFNVFPARLTNITKAAIESVQSR